MSNEMNFNDVVERVKDALAGAATTTGQTFLPTETADEIIQLVYERNFMRSLFPSMPMSRRMMKVPKLTGSVNFHGMSLNTAVSGAGSVQTGVAAPESSQTSNEITLELKTMMANVPIGNYLIAYGVEGLLSVLRDDIASRLAFNEQSLFINGDTETGSSYADNINGIYNASTNASGVGDTSNDYLLLFDGLRKWALSTSGATTVDISSSGAGAAFTLAALRSAINNLGVYADNRDELCLIVPRNLEVQLLGMTELQTVDKYGPGATILSGELGRIYGIRVFATGTIATNLNITGKYATGGSTVQNTTTALLLNLRSPIIGNSTVAERRFAIGFHDEPTKDRFVLIPRQDVAFNVRYPDAICAIVGISTI